MTSQLLHGDCIELMKTLPDASIDLFICDLPYGETNCNWDSTIDMNEFWIQFKRLRKNKNVPCIHFCTTKFGYKLIQSWEKGFKMDMVFKKRNKTGGLHSKYRPMRNHEMIYFFYDQTPKYNRDKYHKRLKKYSHDVEKEDLTMGNTSRWTDPKKIKPLFEPPNPTSVIEENNKSIYGVNLENLQEYAVKDLGNNHNFEPPNPASVFESEKVFIGKRFHQTEKPIDILEFFLKYWSDEGDTILDPTMGSGSTGVACKNLNRNFIGLELDEKIYEVAKNRLS